GRGGLARDLPDELTAEPDADRGAQAGAGGALLRPAQAGRDGEGRGEADQGDVDPVVDQHVDARAEEPDADVERMDGDAERGERPRRTGDRPSGGRTTGCLRCHAAWILRAPRAPDRARVPPADIGILRSPLEKWSGRRLVGCAAVPIAGSITDVSGRTPLV